MVWIALFSVVQAEENALECGIDFDVFLQQMSRMALSQGISENTVVETITSTKYLPEVIALDRSQKAFRLSFADFSRRSVNTYRLINGKKKIIEFSDTFNQIKSNYGIPAEVITAFWAMESDFGEVQGNFHTLSALATLAFDCRRAKLFQEHFLAAIRLIDNSRLTVAATGAWAGEYGQVQMLPTDILRFGKDGDGDGQVTLNESPEDTILTAAALINHLGWNSDEPWLEEVILPKTFHWRETGFGRAKTLHEWVEMGVRPRTKNTFMSEDYNVESILLLPQGRKGPKFLAYPNFNLFLKWNDSFIYSVTTAYLATRLSGYPEYLSEQPENILNKEQMIQLQQILSELEFDVGGLDGILGAKTRQAVRSLQILLGLPADSWPTLELLTLLTN